MNRLLIPITLLSLFLIPVAGYCEREYPTTPRGYGFDVQLCYKKCDKNENTKHETPCCRETCRVTECINNAYNAAAAEKTECQPHSVIQKQCLKKYRINKLKGKVFKIQYRAYAGKRADQQKSGITQIKTSSSYEFLNLTGGCGGRDIARCSITAEGKVRAFFLDACGKKPISRTGSSCAKASFKHYYARCCILTK